MKFLRGYFVRYLTFLVLAGLLLAACAPGTSVEPGVPGNGQPAAATPSTTLPPASTQVQTPSAVSGQTSQPVESLPPAALAAQNALAQQLGIKADTIKTLKVEPVEWPNGCLGVEMPGKMCTQVITSGYRVILAVNRQQYEFHTNENGGVVILATQPLAQTADKVLVWEQTENNMCSRVEIGAKSAAYGQCGASLQEAQLSSGRVDELDFLLTTYTTFTGATKAGVVQFNGQGQQEPTQAEMRSIAEWARLVFMEAQGGRSGAAWGLAFSWHREGGIAGFCDDLGVYLTGWAQPTSCKGNQANNIKEYRLSADELAQMYAWVDQYANFYFEQKDSAVADSMLVKLAFEGKGTQPAATEQQEQIARFAGQIYANATIR